MISPVSSLSKHERIKYYENKMIEILDPIANKDKIVRIDDIKKMTTINFFTAVEC